MSDRDADLRFVGLSHIDDTEPFSEEADGDCLREMSRLMVRHSVHDKLMITLMHTHFPVGPDEVVMDLDGEDDTVSVTEVVRLPDAVALGAAPSSWRLTPSGSSVPLQYAVPDNPNSHPVLESSTFLDEMVSALIKHDKISRFGLSQMEKEADPTGAYVGVEYTNEPERKQWTKLELADGLDDSNSVNTNWIVDPNNIDSQYPGVKCVWKCSKGRNEYDHKSKHIGKRK